MPSCESFLNLVVQYITPYLCWCLFIFTSLMKSTSFVFISTTLTGFAIHAWKWIYFQKPDKFDFAFVEVSLFYSTISRIVKRFVISALPDARSITGPEASKTFFWLCLFIVLFMSFSDVCPYLAHLLNALLGGQGASTPARPLLGTKNPEFITYKNIGELPNGKL